MTREELKQLGLDDEAITKVLNLHHSELTEYKEKVTKLEAAENNAKQLKKDFDEQSEKLKALETGENSPEALKAEIAKLTSAASQKDAEHQKAIEDMKSELENNRFNTKLETLISEAGAKRKKAIIAELDLATLRESKNQDADIKAAIEALKSGEETSFLFEAKEESPATRGVNFPAGTKESNVDALSAQARTIMGLPPETK